MKKKILIMYASYGSGHKTIAEFNEKYLSEHGKYEIKIMDTLDYGGRSAAWTEKAFNHIYNHRREKFFSFLYSISNNEFINKNYYKFVRKFVYNAKMEKDIKSFKPDIIISTHFYGGVIATHMNKLGLIDAKLVTIVTDYKAHRMWMSSYDPNEIFIVANDIVKNDMLKRGCYSQNIYAYGLPFDEKKISQMLSNEQIYAKNNLAPKEKYIMFFGGGSNGSMAYVKYLKKLSSINLKYKVIFICGKNEKLYDFVCKYAKKNPNIIPFGFVTNVYELMEISDIVVSKPGGATVTECLEMQKFLLALPGIGGQEKHNARFIEKNHYGKIIRNSFAFKRFMIKFNEHPEQYLKVYNQNKFHNESLKKIHELIEKL